MVARDYSIAGAEGAQRFAERKMKIERPGGRFVVERFVEFIQPLFSRR